MPTSYATPAPKTISLDDLSPERQRDAISLRRFMLASREVMYFPVGTVSHAVAMDLVNTALARGEEFYDPECGRLMLKVEVAP